MGKSFRWLRSHRRLALSLFLAAAFVLLNLLAYRQAYSMTHFAQGGARSRDLKDLSWWQKAAMLATGYRIPKPANDRTPGDLGLAFTTHRFPSTDGLTLEAWHIEHPESKGLVVLFHGYAACKAAMLREAQAFHELGYAMLLVDFRGSGGSNGQTTTIGVEEANDVACTLEYVRTKWPESPVILFGQSMGSAAILRALCVHNIQPKAVVFESPFDRLLSTVANRFTVRKLPAFPLARLMVFWGGLQHGFSGFAHNPVDYACAVECPTLLLHGEEDRLATKEEAEAVFANLAGEKQLAVFAGVGHQSYVSARPEQWKRTVAAFLSKYMD
jgi:alpha-beta hydrolase superfamily lysophospholipase